MAAAAVCEAGGAVAAVDQWIWIREYVCDRSSSPIVFIRPFLKVLSYGFARDVEKTGGARGWTKKDRRNAGEVEYGTFSFF
jgi:hypothetical protein